MNSTVSQQSQLTANRFGANPGSRIPLSLFTFLGLVSSLNPGVIAARIFPVLPPVNTVIVILLIGLVFIRWKSLRSRVFKMDYFLLLLFGLVFASISLIQDAPEKRFTYQSGQLHWKMCLFYFVFPISVAAFRDVEIDKICRGLLLGQVSNLVASCFQVFGNVAFFTLLTNTPGSETSSARAAGFWGDANEAAVIACIVHLMVSILLFRGRPNFLWSLISMSLVVLTSSRTGFISLFVILIFDILWQSKITVINTVVKMGFLVTAPIVLIVYLKLFGGDDLLARFRSVSDAESESSFSDNRLSRANLFKLAFDSVIEEDPIFGVGAVRMSRIVPLGENGLGPHNLFLYVYGSAGFLAFILMIVYMLTFLVSIFRNLPRNWIASWFVILVGFVFLHSLMMTQHFALLHAIILRLATVARTNPRFSSRARNI
jgi:O-antigen ligase